MQRGAAVNEQFGTRQGSRQGPPAENRRIAGDRIDSRRPTLLELAVETGLQVLQQMLEQDREAVCGPRYRHLSHRAAYRMGTTSSEVVLGGRRVAIRRPRVRAAGREVTLPTFHAMSATDLLAWRAVEQMLVGVATRQYARSLEPIGIGAVTRG